MSETRLWKVGTIVLIIALLLGTWFLAISPRIDDATQAISERSDVEAQNAAYAATVVALKKDFENLDEFEGTLADLQIAIPSGAGLPLLIDQLNALAADTGVVIEQLTADNPTAYVHPEAAEGEVEDPELVAARAGVAPDTLLVIPLGLRVAGSYDQVMSFVDGLQHLDRLTLVHSLSLATGPAQGDAPVVLQITAQTFVLLDNGPTPATTEESSDAATE